MGRSKSLQRDKWFKKINIVEAQTNYGKMYYIVDESYDFIPLVKEYLDMMQINDDQKVSPDTLYHYCNLLRYYWLRQCIWCKKGSNMVEINLDKVSFHLKQVQDFSWLKRIGNVFCVFDQQDSGNISFGVENGDSRYFVKYAGAQTTEYNGCTQDAINILNNAIHVYEDLRHANVVNFIKKIDTHDGVAAVFDWFDGECMWAHWTFDEWDRYRHPASPYYKYKRLNMETRLKSINTIFQFLLFVEQQNYVAVDFYDGSIMYDFNTDTTKICDIDFFRKKPTVNDLGGFFWGPRRFKSPEEYILGAPIDSVTNVHAMGILLFGLIGGEYDRSYKTWEGTKEMYQITRKATFGERELRFQSIKEMYEEWDKAVGEACIL